jgi:hypothetical protein
MDFVNLLLKRTFWVGVRCQLVIQFTPCGGLPVLYVPEYTFSLKREREIGRKYSRRAGESEKSLESGIHFIAVKEKKHNFVRRFPDFARLSF